MPPTSSLNILDEVRSLCPECGEAVPALVIEHEGKVYQRSNCTRHGGQDALIFSDAAFYRRLDNWNEFLFGPAERIQADLSDKPGGSPSPESVNGPALAVIDITNKCNYRCPVCFAETNGHAPHYFLALDQISRMLQSLLDRPTPCRHVQFSGGEPTLHPEFPEILRRARDLGFTHIQVATNGSRFVDLDYTRMCEDAGLHTLYLQFDAMSDDVYLKMRGQRLLDKKIKIVENVVQTNMRLVFVPVIATGINVDHIGPIFRFAVQHSKHVTGISIQPAAFIGRIEIPEGAEPFNLGAMASEFGRQTGLTRFPEDWFPLSAVATITRAVGQIRGERHISPACDAHCSLGTYFYIDDDNQPHCIARFLELERFFRSVGEIAPEPGQGRLRQQISRLKELQRLAACFDQKKAPRGLTFERLLRGLEGWEDKSLGRGPRWFQRGFNGMFVAGMHFMDARSYNFRRLRRCIVQYVTVNGDVVPFCSYNAGPRHRVREESARVGKWGHATHRL